MHLEEAPDLVDDVVELAGLVAVLGLEGVAVHRIADPGHLDAGRGDLLDKVGKQVADLACAEPGDEGDLAGNALRVELLVERDRVIGCRLRPELDADRIGDLTQQLDVGAIKLASALTYPDEMSGDVIGLLGALVDTRHGVFVLKDQRFVRGVEIDGVELVGINTTGFHEGESAIDLGAHSLVALADRARAYEVGVPGVHLSQIGVTTGHEGAGEVESRGRGVVDVDEALRVMSACLGREVEAVDGVASVGRERDTLAGLQIVGARLCVLTGQAADLDHRNAGGVGEHDGHRQQDPQLVAHVVCGDPVEGLGAVASLEDECLAAGDLGQLVAQVIALTGEDQRRHLPEPGDGRVSSRRIEVGGLLGSTDRAEFFKGGNAHSPRIRRVPRPSAPGSQPNKTSASS